MFQDVHSIPWKAAVNPDHLESTFDIVYFWQWLCTPAQNFYLLIKKSFYEVFSLKQKKNMKNILSQINVILEQIRMFVYLEAEETNSQGPYLFLNS